MVTILACALALGHRISTPVMGQIAPSIAARTLDGRTIQIEPFLKKGPVVLIVLRGYPGYQCPFCTEQVGRLLAKADEFRRLKSSVLLIYPGPSESLARYAGEFVAGKDIPPNFRFSIDPDYRTTNRYGLRWDAPGETAHPATFVIAGNGRIAYARVSQGHGDRAPVAEVLACLDRLRSNRDGRSPFSKVLSQGGDR